MGWILYQAYVCTAIETPRDMAENYSNVPAGTLPPHMLEKQMMPANGINHMPEMKNGKG